MNLNDIARLAQQVKPSWCTCRFPHEIDTTTRTGHSKECEATRAVGAEQKGVTNPESPFSTQLSNMKADQLSPENMQHFAELMRPATRPGKRIQIVKMQLKVPSWNEIWSANHWRVRQRIAKRVKERVNTYLHLFERQALPCFIIAQAHFTHPLRS